MATGLPKIVDELNAIVKDVANKIALFPHAKRQMRRVLIDLYIRIFDLLAKLMEWYSNSRSRRTFKLLRKDCYGDFEVELQSIRKWADMINSDAFTNMVIEFRQAREEDRESMRCFMQRISELTANYYETQSNFAMQQTVQKEKAILADPNLPQERLVGLILGRISQEFKLLGANQTATLASMSAAETRTHEAPPVDRSAVGEHGLEESHTKRSVESAITDIGIASLDEFTSANFGPQTREEIERNSEMLKDWFPEGHMHPISPGQESVGQPRLHESIAARISQWVTGRDSQVLCIQFPYNPGQVSAGSRLASYVVSTAWEADYPIISYFCSLPREGVTKGRSMQTIALCEMLASLVGQLIALLPTVLPESAASLDAQRFASLDGTLQTWQQMLSILADVLCLVPQSLLIVIHGLQCLDSERTEEPIREMLDVIRKRIGSGETQRPQILKVLFVTEGQARAVVPWLRRGEYSVDEGSLKRTWS